jgi:hypothetical protein
MRVYEFVNNVGDWTPFESMEKDIFVPGSLVSEGIDILSIEQARRGKDNEDFNLKGYAFIVESNKKKHKAKQQKKYNRIVDLDGDERLASDEVASNSAELSTGVEDFELILDNVDFEIALRQLFDLKEEVAVEYGVDIIQCVKSSLEDLGSSKELLASLVRKDGRLGNVIQTVLTCASNSKYSLQTILERPSSYAFSC